ncbi:MAG: methyltransferase [Saprospiraceae bacterium]
MSGTLIISSTVGICLILLAFLFLKNNQDSKLNWAMFYASLYILVTLPIVNYFCVSQGFWSYVWECSLGLPFDLYFLWIVIWGILPVLILKGKQWVLVTLGLLFFDLVFMPQLEIIGLIRLSPNWIIGELLIIITVFIPSYLWAYFSYSNQHLGVRAFFQVIVMGCLFIIGLPYFIQVYGLANINFRWSTVSFQVLLIIVFPALVAVNDLVVKGKGTPFPYDPTMFLVNTGVYAYVSNPIQWSFTVMFVSMSYYHNSWWIMLGSAISIAYVYGVSNFQEHPDMEVRFGKDWKKYKAEVPKWMFLWKPKSIAKGTIYFDNNCNQCSQIKNWFQQQKTYNLIILPAAEYNGQSLTNATYIDNNGFEYISVEAIACALDHINLAYASLGWFIRFPGVNYLIQAIVDSFGINLSRNTCSVGQ